MTVLGDAAIAMWWNVAVSDRTEFHEWHSKEHLPERLTIEGFRRGSRWEAVDGRGGMFVTYELENYETLTSPGYYARLNQPTPWSVKMMPLHRDMVRSQCRVLASAGAGIASYMWTLRISPQPGREDDLAAYLAGRIRSLTEREGITSARLLKTETPDAAPTREQQIRGGDAVADWIVLVSGYDAPALETIAGSDFEGGHLKEAGADWIGQGVIYRLVHAMTPLDI